MSRKWWRDFLAALTGQVPPPGPQPDTAATALRAAADHFRARSEREGSADFWQAAQWCDGEAAKREEDAK